MTESFYQIEKAYADIRCYQSPRIPIYGGGGSDSAIRALAPHLDTFMLWGEPLADSKTFMSRVTQAAGSNPVGFSVSTRPILAETDAAAWDRAHDILETIQTRMGSRKRRGPENIASQRLLKAAADKEVHDTCLYTALAEATGAPGNSTAFSRHSRNRGPGHA